MDYIAAFFRVPNWPPEPDLLFWIALTLVAGALLGEVVLRWFRLPRIVGYGLSGAAVAAAGFGVGDQIAAGRMRGDVQLLIDLALALLLFELGSRIRLAWLKANPMLWVVSLVEAAVSFTAVLIVLRSLGVEPHAALAGATVAMPASGAMIDRVATELHAAGQVSERMTVLAGLHTLYAVLTLKLVTGWLYVDRHGDWIQGISQPLYTFAGSIILAVLLGRAVKWVMSRLGLGDENSMLLLLGLLLLALTLARMFALSALLVPLLGGVLLRNESERPCIWPRHFGTAGGVLVLILFVVMGAAWSPAGMAEGAFLAVAIVLARAAARLLVLSATSRWSGIELKQGVSLALMLVPMSATALALLADLRTSHPEIAAALAPAVTSAVGLMAIIGPILMQWGLRLSGDYRPPPTKSQQTRAAP